MNPVTTIPVVTKPLYRVHCRNACNRSTSPGPCKITRQMMAPLPTHSETNAMWSTAMTAPRTTTRPENRSKPYVIMSTASRGTTMLLRESSKICSVIHERYKRPSTAPRRNITALPALSPRMAPQEVGERDPRIPPPVCWAVITVARKTRQTAAAMPTWRIYVSAMPYSTPSGQR